MARPEHNTYDFPDDIETVFDVCKDKDIIKKFTKDSKTKSEYLEHIRKHKLGTDMIFCHLSIFYLAIKRDSRLHDFYDEKISEEFDEVS